MPRIPPTRPSTCTRLHEEELPVVLAVEPDQLSADPALLDAHELLVTPYRSEELAARIARARRRVNGVESGDVVRVGALELNLATYQVSIDGRPVDFAYMEYELLKFLGHDRGRQPMTTPTLTRGRSRYDGFRATIKAVGTGPRGSRALSFGEARQAMVELLAGEVSDVQAGAFLVAMRIKGETPEELAGLAQGLRDAAPALRPATGRPLVACAGAYDGTSEGPHLGLAAAVLAAAAGAGIVTHCGDALGPKFGVTPAEVLDALRGNARPSPEESVRMLERSGVAVVHAGEALPGWRRLAALRDQVGVRGPVHSAEKLVDWLGARRFVIGHSHAPYAERIWGALGLLGAERAVAVRGIEGTDVLRPGRPSAADAGGRLELPEQLGLQAGGEPAAPATAALTRAIAAGDEDGGAAHAAILSAGLRLAVAGLAGGAVEGMAMVRAAVADGRATATLDALAG